MKPMNISVDHAGMKKKGRLGHTQIGDFFPRQYASDQVSPAHETDEV